MNNLKNDHELNMLITQVSKELNEDEEWIKSQVYYDLYEELEEVNFQNYKKIRDRYIEEIINNKCLGWYHKTFKYLALKQKEHDEYLLNPFEVEEGVVQCPKCLSYKVYSYSIQLRAADEPMTTMAECTKCKLKWSHN